MINQFSNLTVVDHPLVHHKLSILRNHETEPHQFRHLANELAFLLTYEATRDIQLEDIEIQTPLEKTSHLKVAEKAVAVVPILRAGVGMLDAVLELLPTAAVGFLGMYRDEATAEPVEYFSKLPEHLEHRTVLVLDPMLATGGSASAGCDILKKAKARRIVLVNLVAAPEGVARMQADHPDVRIVTAALDRELNGMSYILPGLGDAGDRLFGTK